MTASALLRHGPEHATVLLDGLSELDEEQGLRDRRRAPRAARRAAGTDEAIYERSGYVTAVHEANTALYGPSSPTDGGNYL